jgi:hypothetical protein
VGKLHLERDERFEVSEVLRNVPEVLVERVQRGWKPAPGRVWNDDQLLNIEPAVRHRAGRAGPGRNRKISCRSTRTVPEPARRPTPERGWCFFSCGRGGSIYDLAAAMWGMNPRGREFLGSASCYRSGFAMERSRPRLSHGLEG